MGGINGMEVYKTTCPIRENQAQIIGVCKEKRNTACDFSNIKIYEEKDFLKCAYQGPNQEIYNKKILPTDSKSRYLYQQMKEHFDLIIEILEESLQLYISYYFAEVLLRNWKNNEGWNYRDINCKNLPYMLLYAEPSYPMYGKLIPKDNDLKAAILKHGRNFVIQNIDMSHYRKIGQKDGFLDAVFYLTQHNFGHIRVDLEESFVFVVLEGKTVVYQKKIIVREGRLNELVQNQKRRDKREERLMEIANGILC